MRTVLNNFLGSIDRIREIADDIDNNAAAALKDPAVLRRHETIECASTVILSGYFESFLRDLAERFTDAVSSAGLPFANLPNEIRFAHYELGGRVLSQRTKDERSSRTSRISATSDNIAVRIASVATAIPYDLLWEAFADTRANPGPLVVSDFLKRFGIDSCWDKMAAKTTTTAGTLRTQLESFILLRNECAHTGTSTTIPLPSDLRGFCDFLLILGTAMVDVLDDHLASL